MPPWASTSSPGASCAQYPRWRTRPTRRLVQRLRQEHHPRHAGRRARRCTAYRFEGYWKDVGTIDSLWDANMDLLAQSSRRWTCYDTDWPIYARHASASRPAFIGQIGGGRPQRFVTERLRDRGRGATTPCFRTGCTVGEGAEVSVFHPHARTRSIESGASGPHTPSSPRAAV